MKKSTLILIAFLLFPITIFAADTTNSLYLANQKVSDRFEEDVSRMAAIMEQVRERKGIKETRVAFGGSDTPVKQADYWVNFAAEAIAYQRVQKYSSKSQLRSGLETLKGKVLTAKKAVGKALE